MRTYFRYTKEEALCYDHLVEYEIPNYCEMHRVIHDAFPYNDKLPEFRYLELGIGTGNLTQTILEGHPNIVVDGYDVSETMLGIASNKLHGYGKRVCLHCADVFTANFRSAYHAASLFLCENQSRIFQSKFLHKIVDVLRPGGYFIVCCHIARKYPFTNLSARKEIFGVNQYCEIKDIWHNGTFGIFQIIKPSRHNICPKKILLESK